ncbi:MAG: translesion error-prone DNA polymerase V autoproteolytic subunit [Neisseriales bacterium]|nr:MAG: translesion error-prone DNA polymerase V autoproteolytic subunit [Neisseriales bacterium]
MSKHQIFELTSKRIYLPLAESKITAGFPTPVTEYNEERLDINDIVATNPHATFYVRVSGSSMIDANIKDGDILVVDKSLEARHNDIVIAVVDGEFTVKTLYHKDGTIKLMPANPEFPEIVLQNEQELNIWGVVSYTIHKNR